MLRPRYPKEHCPIVWAELVMEGKLYIYLLEVVDVARKLLDSIMPGMEKEAEVTEEPKARVPMVWVGSVNHCRDRVEEIILRS